ncbi:unnamed protein product, partial [Timema podura]|nr:unnamed protein product [Timema podura]
MDFWNMRGVCSKENGLQEEMIGRKMYILCVCETKRKGKDVLMTSDGSLAPWSGKENTLYQTLKTSSKNRHYKIYRKAELPERWHYKNNPRTPPLLAVADEGYGFHDMYAAEQYFTREWHITSKLQLDFC